MDEWFHPTLYRAYAYLSMLGLKLNHVSKMGPWYHGKLINPCKHAPLDYCRPKWNNPIIILHGILWCSKTIKSCHENAFCIIVPLFFVNKLWTIIRVANGKPWQTPLSHCNEFDQSAFQRKSVSTIWQEFFMKIVQGIFLYDMSLNLNPCDISFRWLSARLQ